MADVLKTGLGIIEVKVRSERDIRQEAYDQGWEKGIDEACDIFMVTYPCSKCGKEMTVSTGDEKKAIRKFMTENGWQHVDCSSG